MSDAHSPEIRPKVLVLGASGMLGHAVLRVFAHSPNYHVIGTVRTEESARLLPPELAPNLIAGIDFEKTDGLSDLFARARPQVVINCVGVIKQHANATDPLHAISINSLLPHQLARQCGVFGARLVHIGTDCVFTGAKGRYTEGDVCDARDLYGCSKYLGEVDYPHAITLRTSLIGPERRGGRSLIAWFLAQQGSVKGFTRAIFSGLPTVEMAEIIRDYVLPRPELRGVYHVSAGAISKFDLLSLVARVYGKSIAIVPDDRLVIDRSLDCSRFSSVTGYQPKSWPELLRRMHQFA